MMISQGRDDGVLAFLTVISRIVVLARTYPTKLRVDALFAKSGTVRLMSRCDSETKSGKITVEKQLPI
jgi:hypothetical protein